MNWIFKNAYCLLKNEILPFAATWVDLENIMFNKISQRKTNMVWYYMRNLKSIQMNVYTKQKQTHIQKTN